GGISAWASSKIPRTTPGFPLLPLAGEGARRADEGVFATSLVLRNTEPAYCCRALLIARRNPGESPWLVAQHPHPACRPPSPAGGRRGKFGRSEFRSPKFKSHQPISASGWPAITGSSLSQRNLTILPAVSALTSVKDFITSISPMTSPIATASPSFLYMGLSGAGLL